MKKIILSIVFFAAVIQQSNATQWMTSFEDAKKLSIATNKLIVIDFWATWCKPCIEMESNTWNQPEIQELLNGFVPLKIDIDVFRKVSNKYSANRIPYVLIVDANGEVIYNETGYKDKNQMLKVLKKYAINTSALQSDYASFNKEPNAEAAMSIAEKYYDTSIYVNDDVENDYMNLASNYLRMVKKLSTKKEYKEKYEQKADLLDDAYRLLLRGKNEKVLEVLKDKFKESEIASENKGLFDFMHFVAYKKLEDNENAKLWYDKLKTDKNYKFYLLKSRKI
ncbi:thioredoxin family protein [uncultured Tenacibaculum sp.]|uniref:thioredoxin family protein n=2 Tax=Tenacibaculum TaxID=104267 RepID=UPI0026021534|nr:thioredoxin family protein [uncultured Tenacibaculum sp.]